MLACLTAAAQGPQLGAARRMKMSHGMSNGTIRHECRMGPPRTKTRNDNDVLAPSFPMLGLATHLAVFFSRWYITHSDRRYLQMCIR